MLHKVMAEIAKQRRSVALWLYNHLCLYVDNDGVIDNGRITYLATEKSGKVKASGGERTRLKEALELLVAHGVLSVDYYRPNGRMFQIRLNPEAWCIVRRFEKIEVIRQVIAVDSGEILGSNSEGSKRRQFISVKSKDYQRLLNNYKGNALSVAPAVIIETK